MSRFWEALAQIDRKRDLDMAELRIGPGRRGGHPVLSIRGPERSEVETLVNRLYLLPDSAAPQICLFAALEAGSECSRLCAQTSDLLASQLSASVCLVDANSEPSFVQRHWSPPGHSGLADLARDRHLELTEAVSRVPRGDLWVLPRGSRALDESPIESGEIRDRIGELRRHFHFVLLDGPPIGSPQALTLARLADGIVLVLRANSTRRGAAARAKQQLEANGGKILGAILYNLT